MINTHAFIEICGRLSIDFFATVFPAVFMFCHSYNRKPHFYLRVVLTIPYVLLFSSLATLLYITMLRSFPYFPSLFLQYILLLTGIFIIQYVYFDASVSSLLINLLGGYSLNQISQYIFYILSYRLPFIRSLSTTLFGFYLIRAIWFTLSYILVYQLFLKKQNIDDDIKISDLSFYYSIAITLFLIAFNIIRDKYVSSQTVIDYMCIVCMLLFHIFILLFRSGLLNSIASTKEMLLTQKVWEEKEASLRITQDAINTINTKYHDLKYMINMMRSGENTLDFASDLADSLHAYEQTFSTGNSTLDLVLTEAMLRYQQNGVTFVCLADGNALFFMHTTDIISLFSNALENALEAVVKLDVHLREVYCTVRKQAGVVLIQVENPFSSDITFVNGLPATIKQDKNYHGFGMKSIRQTVEKYHGDMQIETENNRFKLKILLPESN